MKKKETSQVPDDKPVQPILKTMNLYDKEYFRIEKMKTVRATTTYLQVLLGVKYRTKQLNEQRLIEVTRIA